MKGVFGVLLISSGIILLIGLFTGQIQFELESLGPSQVKQGH